MFTGRALGLAFAIKPDWALKELKKLGFRERVLGAEFILKNIKDLDAMTIARLLNAVGGQKIHQKKLLRENGWSEHFAELTDLVPATLRKIRKEA